MGYAFSTRCLYGNANVQEKSDRTKALTMPIYQTATFAHAGVGKSTGYDYTRSQNPTREYVEDVVNSLEGGCGALALATGMAAITVTMELFKPGDHIIAGSDLYGGTTRSFEQINMKNGIIVEHVDTDDVNKVEAAIKDNTRGIFIETPSNPLMRVTDVRKLCEMIKGRDILLIADNTFLTPYYMRPLELGADIVIHSGTKYLGGHNDTEAGFIVAKSREIFERLRFIMNTTGPVLSPFDSFLVARGIKTLPLRMDKAQENAFELVKLLKAHPKVKAVNFVGDPSHPGYEISKSQTNGFGAMISFWVDTNKTLVDFLEKIRVIKFAESLGGVESLATYPAMQTHHVIPEHIRTAMGIDDTFIRLSVGIEDIDDLKEDVLQALG